MVSKGANPLPAKVRIKRHTNQEIAKNFYFRDQNKWESTGVATQGEGTANTFRFKTYADPIQEQVRRMVGRSLIFTFGLFVYEEDIDRKNFVPKLPLPHDAFIGSVLTIVNNEKDRCVPEINANSDLTEVFRDRFLATCQWIMCGFIAKQLLGMLLTVQVRKKWNSHGANLGACMC